MADAKSTKPTHKEVFEALFALAYSAQRGGVQEILNSLKRNIDDLGAFDNAHEVLTRAATTGYAEEMGFGEA